MKMKAISYCCSIISDVTAIKACNVVMLTLV